MQFIFRLSFTAFAIAVFSITSLHSSAEAGERVALVIGNSNYSNATSLANPKNDATKIARALEQAGFSSVDLQLDLDAQSMRRALQEFSRTADGAEIALVYFAGHGMEIGGQNYLIPTDARLQHVDDAEFEALPLKTVSRTLGRVGGLKLIVLDACRNNPFVSQMKTKGATRSVGRGLARVSPTGGDSIIAYAAKEGTLALDGDDDNSPYAKALIKHIKTPGLDVRLMFGKVRDEVLKSTAQKQEPFIYSSLGGDPIYLSPGPPSTSTINHERIEQDYKRAETVNTGAAWEAFLTAHGFNSGDFYVNLARAAQQKLALNTPAVTQPTKKRISVCTASEPMLKYAKYILGNRSKLGRYARRGFGTGALYLSYNYNQLSFEETESQARGLIEEYKSDRFARGMHEALVITKLGAIKGLARLGSSELKAFEKLTYHGIRALIISDGGMTYLDLVKKAKAQPSPDTEFIQSYSFGLGAPARVVDQSDAFKSKFAALAEQQGELVLAGGLLGTRSSLKAYETFINKYESNKELQKLINPTQLRGRVLFGFHATGENISLEKDRSEGRLKFQRESDAIINAGFHVGEIDFLTTMLNFTGKGAEIAGASNVLLSAILSGEINPIRSPESSWILSYKSLVDFMGRKTVDEMLMSFDGFNNHHYKGRVREGLDWVIASQALKDSSNPGGVIPSRPRLLSKEFDWNTWVMIAERIRVWALGPDLDILKKHPNISAELLFQAGFHDVLFEHLTVNIDLPTRMKFIRDFMLRIDRRCGAFTSMAGQALILGGETPYTFASHH